MTADASLEDASLEAAINDAWDRRAELNAQTTGQLREAVDAAIAMLDDGRARIAEPGEKDAQGRRAWHVHEWLKKAVLLSFRLNANALIEGAPGAGPWWDKVAMKCADWSAEDFAKAGFRAVPPTAVRRGTFIGADAVLMPSYINIGAWIGPGAMIDIWSCVGSCAQIGAHCHISANVTIGGVLEPLQAEPVIIEDNCFIGAQSAVTEGVIVREGAVLAMGVRLGKSTPIVDRETGETSYGEAPPYAVLAPGSRGDGPVQTACAVIIKRVDEATRARTSINDLLRA